MIACGCVANDVTHQRDESFDQNLQMNVSQLCLPKSGMDRNSGRFMFLILALLELRTHSGGRPTDNQHSWIGNFGLGSLSAGGAAEIQSSGP